MVTGTVISNQIAFNGTIFSPQPTSHGWKDRESIGTDGNGVEIYVTPRQYEMTWDALDTDQYRTLYSYFLAQGVTGSIVTSLPKWDANPYQMYAYSGTILREPKYDGFFMNYYQSVTLLVVRITGT